MAGVVGFEPTQAVLETDVLPLTLYPYKINIIIIAYKKEFDKRRMKNNCKFYIV